MWQKIIDFVKSIEPLLLILIPLLYSVCIKLKSKIVEQNIKIQTQQKDKNEQKLLDWRHEESIKVINRLKEICNYHCDISHIHTSYIQLENGTIATSKLCNMFFSCIAEDNRYSNLPKLIDIVQRIPYIRLSGWFNKIQQTDHQVVYISDKKYIDDLFYDKIGIRCLVSGFVRDSNGLIIGVCNFMFIEEQDTASLDECHSQMLKFISSVETLFLDFNINLKNKRESLGFKDED